MALSRVTVEPSGSEVAERPYLRGSPLGDEVVGVGSPSGDEVVGVGSPSGDGVVGVGILWDAVLSCVAVVSVCSAQGVGPSRGAE